jgi:hypothetical protein
LLDGIQLSQAINEVRDRETKAFLAAAASLGTTDAWSAAEEVAAAGLRSKRSAIGVYEAGLRILQGEQRKRRQLLRRVRAQGGTSDSPVCWRCLKKPVKRVGDECGQECPALDSNWKSGPPPKRIEDMSVEELVETQEEDTSQPYNWNRLIPGGAYYQKKIAPMGFHRDEGSEWATRGLR